MAEYYRIDLGEPGEMHLLAVAKEGAAAPVLPPWEERVDGDGHPYFYHTGKHVRSNRHPLDKKFLKLVNDLRAAGAPPGTEGRSVLALEQADGSTVFYDFSAKAEVLSPPEDAVIPALPREVVPVYESHDLMRSTYKVDLNALNALTFYSWWSESMCEEGNLGNGMTTGGKLEKRYITILFHLDTQKFEVKMEGSEDIHLAELTSVTVDGLQGEGKGAGVNCWDLHIGACVHILGKRTTLRQANVETVAFIEHHANALRKTKAKLIEALRKYRTVPLPPALCFEKGTHTLGGVSVRALMEQVGFLREELAQYRPSLAERIAPLPVAVEAVPVAVEAAQ